jgi:hypothetical protein
MGYIYKNLGVKTGELSKFGALQTPPIFKRRFGYEVTFFPSMLFLCFFFASSPLFSFHRH